MNHVSHADIEAMIPRVRMLLHSTFAGVPSHIDRDDLLQAAMEAVIRHRHHYDPCKGASWLTFATYRAEGAIRDHLRQQIPGSRSNPQPFPLSLDEHFIVDDDEGATISQFFAVEDPEPHDELYYRRLTREVDRLPDGIVTAFRLYAEADMTMGEIGELEGVTESRISQKISRARELLRPRVAPLLLDAA